jgi:molybdopterin converting factor small subunit
MAAATSDGLATLELHGFLADRLAPLGRRRGTRTLIDVPLAGTERVGDVLARLVGHDAQLGLLYEVDAERLPEHVEVVLNERLLDLQGGLEAALKPGDVLTFLPAHAGG